jgi:oxygen-independent coproporphyrinogen-3 oxidase
MQLPHDLLQKYNQALPRYTSYPPANFFEQHHHSDEMKTLLEQSNQEHPKAVSLYIHIPFCPKLCLYCGCNTVISKSNIRKAEYLAVLKKEIRKVAAIIDDSRFVTQVHWGGGTPNYLEIGQVKEIMQLFYDLFRFSGKPEIAMECHPAYLDKTYIDGLLEIGFNRFSLGIQDFNEKVLSTVHRDPSALPVKELTDYIRRDGKASVNLDFIYGLPFQTPESFANTLQKAIEVNPDRLVTFSYAHVPWIKKQQKKLEVFGLPTPDEKMAMFETAHDLLTGAGYHAIGLDHFAKAEDDLTIALNNKVLHRNFQGYCTRETTGQVYAFGVSAISQLNSAYIQNTKTIKTYQQALESDSWPVEKIYVLSKQEQMMRTIIEQLMCNQYLNWEQVAHQENTDIAAMKAVSAITNEKLDAFAGDGLLEYSDKEIRVTSLGKFFIRNIAAAFDPLLRHTDKKFSKSV